MRAKHDRRVLRDDQLLWAHVAAGPALGTMKVGVSAQRRGLASNRRVTREAPLTLRAACVDLPPPTKDTRIADAAPITVHVVHVLEERPPAGKGVQRVEWMLLSNEPATTAADASRLTAWYARRWVVEEFHRAEKEGCRLESTQVDDALDIQRLAAITAVVAVRLRDPENATERGPESGVGGGSPSGGGGGAGGAATPAEDVSKLTALVDEPARRVVAALAGTPLKTLTPRKFYEILARRGGWLGRKNNPRPGWKCLWQGWRDIQLITLGSTLAITDGS